MMNKDEQDVQEQAAKEMADPQIMGAETAFLIFVQNGQAFACNDLGTVEIRIDGKTVQLESMRRASADDLYRYAMEVAKDVQVGQTAEAVVQSTMQISQQMAQQAQAQRIARDAGVGPRPGGLHVPGS